MVMHLLPALTYRMCISACAVYMHGHVPAYGFMSMCTRMCMRMRARLLNMFLLLLLLLASLKLKTGDDHLKPVLMDNGASKGTSCSKSLDGALPGTLRLSDAGDIRLGSDGSVLTSLGSYLYVLERRGANGSEIVVRRMKHTPSLPMAMVFSEASENAKHGYGIYWTPGEKRKIEPPGGPTLELFMSGSNLGWMKVKPVTDCDMIRRAIEEHRPNGNVMGGIETGLDPGCRCGGETAA